MAMIIMDDGTRFSEDEVKDNIGKDKEYKYSDISMVIDDEHIGDEFGGGRYSWSEWKEEKRTRNQNKKWKKLAQLKKSKKKKKR